MTVTDSGTRFAWRKARRCESTGCVEVAETVGGMAVRDSTLPDGAVLHFDSANWQTFITGLNPGTPDRQPQ